MGVETETRPRRPGNPDELFKEARVLLEAGSISAAVRLARRAAALRLDSPVAIMNLGGVLIDAGADSGSIRLIREGVDRLESIAGADLAEWAAGYQYNLGTGYSYLGDRERGFSPGTRPSLVRSVFHFDESLRLQPTTETRVNLAGALYSQGRVVEALDELNKVLALDPRHHVALAKRATCFDAMDRFFRPQAGLLGYALKDLKQARREAADLPTYRQSYEAHIKALVKRDVRVPRTVPFAERTAFEEWVWREALCLNPCPGCEAATPDAYDVFVLAGVLNAHRRRPPVDDVFSGFNALNRSYAAARWMLAQAAGVAGTPKQPGQLVAAMAGTTDPPKLSEGLMMAAFGGFYSLLDQIAFALNAYFALRHQPHRLNFQSVWNPPGTRNAEAADDRASLHKAVRRRPLWQLAALHRLAISFERGAGRYAELRATRNALQHRLISFSGRGQSASSYFVNMSLSDLEEHALKMGRIARAALWYFGATVWAAERKRAAASTRAGEVVRVGRDYRVSRH